MIIARIMLIALAVNFCSSCSRKMSPGIYQTNCIFLRMPEAYYQFKKDSSFVYFRTLTKEMQFEGVWKVNNSILTLESNYYVTDTGRSEIGSKYRHTLPSYKIKRNKLIEITTHKYRKKKCYLFKVNNYPDSILSGL
jgi:hypothetical protein